VDARFIGLAKGLIAGSCDTLLALGAGAAWPAGGTLGAVLAVAFLGDPVTPRLAIAAAAMAAGVWIHVTEGPEHARRA